MQQMVPNLWINDGLVEEAVSFYCSLLEGSRIVSSNDYGPDAGEYAVAFVLPSSLTLDHAPVPTNPDVQLHQRPSALVAALGYRGRWTRASFERHHEELQRAVASAGLTPVGAPTWARFDPPFVPWFLRRNEVLQEVAGQSDHEVDHQVDHQVDR